MLTYFNRAIGKWNKDLLSMCGLVLRVFYDGMVALVDFKEPALPKEQHEIMGKKGSKKGRNKYVLIHSRLHSLIYLVERRRNQLL